MYKHPLEDLPTYLRIIDPIPFAENNCSTKLPALNPYRKLLSHLLFDAMHAILKTRSRSSTQRRLDLDWIRGADNRLLSFQLVCDGLGLDAGCVRKEIFERLQKKKLTAQPEQEYKRA